MRAWYTIATAAIWRSPAQISATDPTASILANRFRLVVKVDYAEQKLFIRCFGTHRQYSAINAAEI